MDLGLKTVGIVFIFSIILQGPASWGNDKGTKNIFRPPSGSAFKKSGEKERERVNQERLARDGADSSSQGLSYDQRIPTQIRKHGIGIGLGQTFLLGQFEKLGENKITLDAFYSYTASYSFDFLVNYHHSKHKFRETNVVLNGLSLAIKAKLYQFDAFSPFVLGGLGFYRPKATRQVTYLGIVESESKTSFGAHIGFGGDLKLNNNVTVGLLGHYHNPFDIKQSVGPKVEGSYFKLLMTAMVTI